MKKRIVAELSTAADEEIFEETLDKLTEIKDCIHDLTRAIDEFRKIGYIYLVEAESYSLEDVKDFLERIDSTNGSSQLERLGIHVSDAIEEIETALYE